MKKNLFALATLAAFALVGFAGAAVAAPVHVVPSVSADQGLQTVAAKKKASTKKATHKASKKKAK